MTTFFPQDPPPEPEPGPPRRHDLAARLQDARARHRPAHDGLAVIACGPANEPGFTHLLTIDPTRLPPDFRRALEGSPRIEQAVWPGADRLYVRAPHALAEEVLATARHLGALMEPDAPADTTPMATDRRGDPLGALARVAETFDDAREFEPDLAVEDRDLPGRGAGAWPPVHVDEAGVLDCGTSRRDGFTHVLWVDRSVVPADLAERAATLPGVANVAWEGSELLHLEAHGASHADVLAEARSLARA